MWTPWCLHRERLIVRPDRSPVLFGSRFSFLVLQSTFLGAPTWLGLFAHLGGHSHCLDHVTQSRKTIRNVSPLIPESMTTYHQFAVFRNTAFVFFKKPLPDALGQVGCPHDIPFENGLGVHLVDVLAARTGRTGKAKIKFLQRDLNATRYF